MKIIQITEAQAYKIGLLEDEGMTSSSIFDPTDTTVLGNHEVSTGAIIHNPSDGDEEPSGDGAYATPSTADRVSKSRTPKSPFNAFI